MSHTPVELTLLLWYHFRCEDIEKISSNSNLKAAVRLEGEGLIKVKPSPTDVSWELTDKGRFFVRMLCETPLPKMEWCDPREA